MHKKDAVLHNGTLLRRSKGRSELMFPGEYRQLIVHFCQRQSLSYEVLIIKAKLAAYMVWFALTSQNRIPFAEKMYS